MAQPWSGHVAFNMKALPLFTARMKLFGLYRHPIHPASCGLGDSLHTCGFFPLEAALS